MSTSQGPFPMENTYTWETTLTGTTRITLRNRREPSGFARLATPLLKAANAKDLARLKSLLERR
jgi:hypothetical protein